MLDQSQLGEPRGWEGYAAAVVAFALLFGTLDQPTITWDEGFTLRREQSVREWFALWLNPPGALSRSQVASAEVIQRFWPFAREEPDGHPPFYAILGNVGYVISQRWLGPLEAHRFGPIVLFSITVGVMYTFMGNRFGRLAGMASGGTWLLMPRVFAHAHLASYDVPLACFWFLIVVAFWKVLEAQFVSLRRGLIWSATFGLFLALAAATKFTGWLIPLPLLVWSVAAGARRLRREGFASLRQLVLPSVFLLPLVAMTPELFRLIRQLEATEASLESLPDENSQMRHRRAADLFRSHASGRIGFGWLVIPAVGWCMVAWWRIRDAARASSVAFAPLPKVWSAAFALSPALAVAFCPPWWHDPLRGIAIFLWSNLSRAETTFIPTQFFGQTYEFALPWYNTLAWVALTVPPLMLLLMLCGLAGVSLKESKSVASEGGHLPLARAGLTWLLIINAATLLTIRALPNAPGHDGERQLLGSFPFLAALAGVGACCMRTVLERATSLRVARWAARALVAAAIAWASFDIWHYRPVWLSYYTELIGGLDGAAQRGLEPTYYWDALDEETLGWLNQHTSSDEAVVFCNDFASLNYLRRWGDLQVNLIPHEAGIPRWYVLQNRPGLFAERPWDRWLAEYGTAAFVRSEQDVPLIWVFAVEEYEKARRNSP